MRRSNGPLLAKGEVASECVLRTIRFVPIAPAALRSTGELGLETAVNSISFEVKVS
jgi:hypothetical protein